MSTDYLPIEPAQVVSPKLETKDTWRRCKVEARYILNRTNLSWTSINLYLEKDQSGKTRPIIQIEVPDTSSQDLWRPVIVTISHMLYMKECTELAVQICTAPENHCYAIEFGDPLREAWTERLKAPVMGILEGNTQWETVSVFRYGRSEGEAKPTVIVTVPNITEQDYNLLEGRIRSKLEELGAGALEVKILQGRLDYAVAYD